MDSLERIAVHLERCADVFEKMLEREIEERGDYSRTYVEGLEKRLEELQPKYDELAAELKRERDKNMRIDTTKGPDF